MTQQAQHTAGWNVVEGKNENGQYVIADRNNNFVAATYATDYTNLIAAAPDLLALVKRAEFYINEQRKAGIGIGRTSSQFLVDAKEAIAKAEGK